MASPKTLVKRYTQFSGLDLKSSELNRDVRFSPGMRNAQYRKTGSIEKRSGFQAHAKGGGGYGLHTFSRINPDTGIVEPETLSVADTLYKLKESVITVTYTGADPTAIVSVFFDKATETYRCQVTEGTTLLLDEDLGKGYDEGSTVTINTLKTAIDALANFGATITGSTSTPAAFIETTIDCDLNQEDCLLTAKYWEAVNSPASNMLNGSVTNSNNSDFENASFVQINNVMYVSNGYDDVLKYDGQNLYRAGLRAPDEPTINLVAGSITYANGYSYRIQYINYDAGGGITESDLAIESPQTGALAAQDVEVTVFNIEDGEKFNTNCAVVNGAQAVVNTITVDNGLGGNHTMKAGDTAYFYDAVTGDYVERKVTAVAATTITVAGAAVTVADNAVISNNLRIAIWRGPVVGGVVTTWYFIKEIPNNSFVPSQVYTDNTVSGAEGEELIEPATDRGLPPKGKYVSVFRNQLVVAGKIDEPNTVFWSDVESPEYFPVNNQTDVNTLAGDVISGLAPNNEVFAIFKKRSIFILSGNIAENTIRFDQITSDIGCVAHHTIHEVRGFLCFLSDLGPRKMIGGQIPVALGESTDNALISRIDPIFEQAYKTDEEKYVPLRAVAINDRLREKYMLFIPCESVDPSGDVYANSFSRVFSYDYSRDAWLEWTNINGAGGFTTVNEELYWVERGYSTFATDIRKVMFRRHNLGTAFDYQDNFEAIDFSYTTQWEALNEPSVMKKFLNARIFSVEDVSYNETNLSVVAEHNYVPDNTKSSFMLQFGGGGYGISAYGDSPYGDPALIAKKHKLNSSRTRSLRLVFSNAEMQENAIITGWELEVATPFAASMKS